MIAATMPRVGDAVTVGIALGAMLACFIAGATSIAMHDKKVPAPKRYLISGAAAVGAFVLTLIATAIIHHYMWVDYTRQVGR